MINIQLKTKHASWMTVIWIIVAVYTMLTAPEAKAQTAQQMATCDMLAAAAKVTMDARQNGVPIEQQLQYAVDTGMAGMVLMVNHAYETPIRKGAQAKRVEGYKFDQLYWRVCVKKMVLR